MVLKELKAGLDPEDLFHTVWKHSQSWGPAPDEHLRTEPRSCWVLRVGSWRYRYPCLWWSWTLLDTRYDHYRKTYSSAAEWHPTPEMVQHKQIKKRPSYSDNLTLYFLSVDSDSPQNKCSLLLYHNPTTGQHSHNLLLQPVNKQQLCYLKIYGRVFTYVKT